MHINTIVDHLKEYDPEKIIIFGSQARGDATDDSDVDLLVIKETQKRFFDRLKDIRKLLPSMIGIDVFVMTPQEFQRKQDEGRLFVEEVINDGKVLYERH